ncbi:MAG: glycosyltransferase family 2 protein, partial [Chloroflexota bacterium]
MTPAPTPRLSLCMIVRDEEAQLGACLASAAPWVDEMVVCDTGSRDRTVALAARLGASVVHAAWHDDFAAARNEALAHATGDWVLSLDADEQLAAGAGPRLRDLAGTRPSPMEPCIYQLRVRHHLDARDPSQVTEQDFGRLFSRHPRLRWVSPIHEYVSWQAGPPGERLLVLHAPDVVVEHHGHAAGPRQARDKAGRNIGLLRRAMAQAPQDGYFAFKLAQQLLEAGDYPEAAALVRGGIDLALHG